jgi:hypothetical protein
MKDALKHEKFEKLSAIRSEFEALKSTELASNTGLFRWWVLRLILACFGELYAIAYRMKDRKGVE